jgi:hypothetical protein
MNLLHMPEGNRTIKVYSSFSDFASQSSRQEPLHAVSELRHSGDDKRAVLILLIRRAQYSASDLLDRAPLLIVDFQFQRSPALGVMPFRRW